MMAQAALWWCQIFGYASCADASTFESILLAAGAFFAFGLAVSGIAAIFEGLRPR